MVFACDPDRNGNGQMKISFERNTLKVTWYETVTYINLSINQGVLWYKMKGDKYFHNTYSVTSSVNNSTCISLLDLTGQLGIGKR